ncbi:hypothetical protein ACLOJK_000842 [Asimina triloba]
MLRHRLECLYYRVESFDGARSPINAGATGENAEASSVNKLEHDALLPAALGISNLADEEFHIMDDPLCDVGKGGRGRNRGKRNDRKTKADLNSFEMIIVYQPDVTFVRAIEIYKVENRSKKVNAYFLFYEDSTEFQKFEASICWKNGAFDSLIKQKSLMTIPVDQVIVDMREFMSSLPNVLHMKGM